MLDKVLSSPRIAGSQGIEKPAMPSFSESSPANEFQSVLDEAIFRVEQFRIKADESTNRFLNGENEEIHQVVLAGQRADLAFETLLQVRNKVVNAYQEVMRMQL
jgi:flagellar hook-basal body complex protein FliE